MKKLYPKSYEYIYLQIIISIPVIFFIYVLVYGLINTFSEIPIIFYIGASAYLLLGYIPQEINFSSIYIKLYDDYLYVTNQRVPYKKRTQFETKIFYNNITNIEIVTSLNNSLNKKIYKLLYGNLRIKKYLEFTLVDGCKKRIWIDYYTKRQVQKMLDRISNFVEINSQEIMTKWYSTFNEYKKIKNNMNKSNE